MKLKLVYILVALLFIISACKKEKVGGECEYESVKKEVAVTFVDGKLDAVFTASFQPVGIDTDEIYRITDKQFKKIKRNFDLSELSNKENYYSLIIEEISKGSCVPFVIKEIELK